MGFSLALTVGGAISFLLNLLGFLPLLINRVEPVFGESLKNWLILQVGRIPWFASFLVPLVTAIPTTMLLGFLVWAGLGLLIAGFFAMFKGLKGILIGGVIAALVVMYVTGQFGAFFGS